MKRKIVFLLPFFMFVLFAFQVVAQEAWSLQKCIQYAFENNLQIKKSQLDVQSSAADLLQSKLNFLPSVNASASQNTGWGRSIDLATYQYTDKKSSQDYFSLNGNLNLFNGFQNVNKLRQQQFNYLAMKYNSDKIRNDIALNIAAAYLQILFNIEQADNARRQLETTKAQINRTRKEVEAGTVAKGNLLDIEAQGANDQVNVVNAQNKLMLSYLDLMQLLDLKAKTKFEIEKPNLEITKKPSLLPIESIYRNALNTRPEIKSAQYYVKSAARGLSIAKGQRSPSLSMSSSYSNNYSDQIRQSNNPLDPGYNLTKEFWDQMRDNRSVTLGFRLSIPILNGYQVSTYIKKSKISLEKANLDLQLQKNNLRKTIEQAYTDALAAYQTYVARDKSVASLEEAFKYAQEKFNVGMLSATDYNVAKNNFFNAQSNRTAAKYDYIFKTKILDFYLGRSLNLNDIASDTSQSK